MTTIPREHWFKVDSGESHPLPIIDCPACGGGTLGPPAPNGIHADGVVYASVVCAHKGCTFHDFVTLEGWDGGEVAHR